MQRTNDRRYESKDSRDMLKGSSSLAKLRCSEDESELEDLPFQKPGLSGGAGGRNTPLSFISRPDDVS
jgi:hypothetical protein